MNWGWSILTPREKSVKQENTENKGKISKFSEKYNEELPETLQLSNISINALTSEYKKHKQEEIHFYNKT